jgi:ParB-like chromosome segregation protein Spo0J
MTTTSDPKRPVVLWDIGNLIPFEKNAKKHPDQQVEKLAKSIAKFGIANPINIKPTGEIITGHGRRLAAIKLGLKRVPVIVRDDLTDEEADALRISDNQVTSTDYDTELLKDAMMDLSAAGFEDMDTLGFDDAEITRLTADFGDISMDEGVFAEDITTAVEEQKEQNAAKEAAVDKSAAPVADALGFKRVTVEQSRKIREFMAAIEAKSGRQGADALLYVLERAS